MALIRALQKSSALFAVLALLLSVVANSQQLPEREGFFDIRSASTTQNEGIYELQARLQLVLSDEALDALNSGVPLMIEVDFQVIRSRRFWVDAEQAALTFRYELQYRPLSQRYIVANLNSGNQESFATLYAALNNLGRIQDLPVLDSNLLDPDSRYRLRLRARLSTRQYPAPLRMLFFWQSQWHLASDWYEWFLER